MTVEHLAFVATEVLFRYRLTGGFTRTTQSLCSVRSLLLVQMSLGLSSYKYHLDIKNNGNSI